MKKIKIRPALFEDMPDLLRMIKELAEFEKLAHEVSADVKKLAATLLSPHSSAEAVFIEVDDRKVGFALFFSTYSTFLAQSGIYLEDLYIQSAHRGQGYGRCLLAHIAQLAIKRKCGRVEWSVLDWNEKALKFYRSAGAEAMSAWTTQRLSGPALEAFAQTADF